MLTEWLGPPVQLSPSIKAAIPAPQPPATPQRRLLPDEPPTIYGHHRPHTTHTHNHNPHTPTFQLSPITNTQINTTHNTSEWYTPHPHLNDPYPPPTHLNDTLHSPILLNDTLHTPIRLNDIHTPPINLNDTPTPTHLNDILTYPIHSNDTYTTTT